MPLESASYTATTGMRRRVKKAIRGATRKAKLLAKWVASDFGKIRSLPVSVLP